MLSLLQVFAADDSKLDGFNASMYLIDEYHAAKNTGLKDVLQSSQGMRDNPMAVIITTAGFDKLGPCYQYREMCTEVLSGLKENDALFAGIFSPDEGTIGKIRKRGRRVTLIWELQSNCNIYRHKSNQQLMLHRKKSALKQRISISGVTRKPYGYRTIIFCRLPLILTLNSSGIWIAMPVLTCQVPATLPVLILCFPHRISTISKHSITCRKLRCKKRDSKIYTENGEDRDLSPLRRVM